MSNIPSKPGLVTFTFDDGVSANYNQLLDILKKEDVKATFFVIGNSLMSSRIPRLKRAHDEGHTIGNHTWSHPQMTHLSPEQLKKEVNATSEKIESIIGVKPKYIRPPYGDINNIVRSELAAMGYTVVLWNVDAEDWDPKRPDETIWKYYEDLFSKTDPTKHSYIILQHDRAVRSVEMTPKIIKLVRDKGFKIVSLDEYLHGSHTA